ncbi:hypothetical protein TNIN_215441, partial [Trichonephila inaurata madagascariensis]
ATHPLFLVGLSLMFLAAFSRWTLIYHFTPLIAAGLLLAWTYDFRLFSFFTVDYIFQGDVCCLTRVHQLPALLVPEFCALPLQSWCSIPGFPDPVPGFLFLGFPAPVPACVPGFPCQAGSSLPPLQCYTS